MRTSPIYHGLILNFHQPPGNLDFLLDEEEWEAKQILWAMDKMPRALWDVADVARVHLALSGTLLETISDPVFQGRVYGTTKLGDMLWHYQNEKIFNVFGTGYYHPVFALIPSADWEAHIERWLGIGRHLFWRSNFGGFWPPEMGFCMEMIPVLRRFGFRYVMVDSNYVKPVDGEMRWDELRYRPHLARYGGEEITVVVRDRELSDAQESGMDFGWFEKELRERTQHCDYEPLVVTATDGDNGGWFRNTDEHSNFWDSFYRPFIDRVHREETNIVPTFIDDYLDRNPAETYVEVETGAWNTGWHHGRGFVQWTGSDLQKAALKRIHDFSERFHDHVAALADSGRKAALDEAALEEVRWRLLRAETSCNLYWGEAWVSRIHGDLDEAEARLQVLKDQRS